MKKWFAVLLLGALLCGCGAQPTFETVDDDDSLAVSASVKKIMLDLPKEAATPTAESAGGSLYLCDGYTLTVQTLTGGDLDRTLTQITGYSQQELRPIRTRSGDATRYELVWSAAGESGDQIARAVILDDGSSHYAVTVMADAGKGGQLLETWQELLDSVTLGTD